MRKLRCSYSVVARASPPAGSGIVSMPVTNCAGKRGGTPLEPAGEDTRATKNEQLIQALAAARKTSSNSSKRPSSDIVKPPPKPLGNGKRRKIGAQPGHPKHEHPAFKPEQIDQRIPYELKRCPVDPSHRLVRLADQQKIIQQAELVAKLRFGRVVRHLRPELRWQFGGRLFGCLSQIRPPMWRAHPILPGSLDPRGQIPLRIS